MLILKTSLDYISTTFFLQVVMLWAKLFSLLVNQRFKIFYKEKHLVDDCFRYVCKNHLWFKSMELKIAKRFSLEKAVYE